MKFFKTISELKSELKNIRKEGKTVGLVPTMGFLHEGHLSLAKASSEENDITVMSIFVNPTQFGPNEDFESYPRDLSRDMRLAEEAGVDIIFAPTSEEMYPEGFNTFVDVYGITEKMCGKSRLGHFRGVCTVVNKLFNIVEPDRAYFGQKDAQQAAVIKKMVKDLNMNLSIVICPIVREKDGLAKSSRNIYLNPEERKAALVLYKSLKKAEEAIKNGERDIQTVKRIMENTIAGEKLAEIDYIEICDADTLGDIEKINGRVLIALAVKIGKTRLIDNIILEV